MTRNELTKMTGSGLRSAYEQVEDLIGLGVLKETVNGRIRVALDPEFPLHDNLRDLLLLSREYLCTQQDVLAAVDRICADKYYLGSFTAARLRGLGKLANIKVYEKNMEEAGDITVIIYECKSIPPDVIRSEFLGVEVWMASVERGIIECLTRETPFTLYGSYLALLQNRLDNVLDIAYFKKLAEEEESLSLILAVMSKFNETLGKIHFKLTEKDKIMATHVHTGRERFKDVYDLMVLFNLDFDRTIVNNKLALIAEKRGIDALELYRSSANTVMAFGERNNEAQGFASMVCGGGKRLIKEWEIMCEKTAEKILLLDQE